MEVVVVGAPGSGARIVGRLLAGRLGAQFIDLTGDPSQWVDRVAGLRLSPDSRPGGPVRRVLAADRVVADPAIRDRLYRGRRVFWLDAPRERLVERLRAARPGDHGIAGDLRTFTDRHLAEYRPYYAAGVRIDASGSVADALDRVEPRLADAPPAGTLVLRAELHGGLLELGEGILAQSLEHVIGRFGAGRSVVLTTPASRHLADTAVGLIRGQGIDVAVEELPDGEPGKRLDVLEPLFRALARRRLERGNPLIALGDDALLEAATFAAAVWLRGAPLVTVPVTTLGLIDTAIGGKGGIDLLGVGRNLLGAIRQPVATVLDVALVDDEPADDRRAALSEAVKYALLGDGQLFALLESGAREETPPGWPTGGELLELVERCALAKRELVLLDELDQTGVRMALNLGHTLSHALEAALGYRIRHGDAVAYGLRAALHIGGEFGVTPRPTVLRALRVLDALGLGTEPVKVPLEDILGYVAADKKRRDGRQRWVLVGTTSVEIHDDVPAAIVRDGIARALEGCP